jgi:hypothetical protein
MRKAPSRGIGVLSVQPFARASWQTKPSSELNISVSLEQLVLKRLQIEEGDQAKDD